MTPTYETILDSLDRVYELQEQSGTTFAERSGGTSAGTSVDVSTRLDEGPRPWLPSAINFASTSHVISLPDFILSGAFTVGAWVARTGADRSANAAVFGHTSLNRWLLMSPNTTEIFTRVQSGGRGLRITHGVTDTEWNHFCWRRNADNRVDVLINGALRQANIYNAADQTADTNFNRLGQGDGANHPMNGSICQPFTHNEAVSDEDIATLVAGPQAKLLTGLTQPANTPLTQPLSA